MHSTTPRTASRTRPNRPRWRLGHNAERPCAALSPRPEVGTPLGLAGPLIACPWRASRDALHSGLEFAGQTVSDDGGVIGVLRISGHAGEATAAWVSTDGIEILALPSEDCVCVFPLRAATVSRAVAAAYFAPCALARARATGAVSSTRRQSSTAAINNRSVMGM